MRAAAGLILVATLGLVLGCGITRGQSSVPALLASPSAQTRAELARVITEALHVPVRLAADALVHDSVLIVERIMPRDATGAPLDGRMPGRPEHFRLVMQGSRCVVVQERTSRSWTLGSASCKPAAAGS
ncbi:MAG: hypothetical protein PVSMB6_00960 [Steroidobacteraceae bacterium]